MDHGFHFGLPNFCNGGILSNHLSGGGVVFGVPKRDGSCWGSRYTNKTDQSQQLDAMSWSWETSTTASGPAPAYSRGLNIDPRYVQHWKGPGTRNLALRHPKPRLGSRRDRPPVGRDPWREGKGPANALCGVGDPEVEPGRRKARAGPVAGAGLSPPGNPVPDWM